eukprot:scaffold4945_cov46-Cyclotella_meneghiniana.AAC.3
MVSTRPLRKSITLSTIINILAILAVSIDLFLNHLQLHDHAVQQSSRTAISDYLLLPSSASGISISNKNNDRYGPISLTIPHGKAVARTAARLSEEEDAKIKRAQYGGKGDPTHLVRKK